MRNISFALTTPQFIAGTKDVTRRMGWLFLKPGDVLQAVEKGQGLGKGGKIKRLGTIRVLDVHREKLCAIQGYARYGKSNVYLSSVCTFAMADAILSLPVQSGSPPRVPG